MGNELNLMQESPFVSIIMPTYNREKLIGRAIESILSQSYKDFQLIIIDDGSTDGTEAVVKKYTDDNRVNYYKQENSGRPSLARNSALKYVKGKWVAFLDSDDTWYPDKLKQQIDLIDFSLKNGFDLSIVSGDYDEITNGTKTSQSFFRNYNVKNILKRYVVLSSGVGVVYQKDGFLKQLYSRGFLSTQANLVKASYLFEEGGFREDLHFFEDTDLWLKLASKSNVGLIYAPLATYHLHGNNITTGQPTKLLTDTIMGLRDHLNKSSLSCQTKELIKERICYYKLNLCRNDNGEKFFMSEFVYSKRNAKQLVKLIVRKIINMGSSK